MHIATSVNTEWESERARKHGQGKREKKKSSCPRTDNANDKEQWGVFCLENGAKTRDNPNVGRVGRAEGEPSTKTNPSMHVIAESTGGQYTMPQPAEYASQQHNGNEHYFRHRRRFMYTRISTRMQPAHRNRMAGRSSSGRAVGIVRSIRRKSHIRKQCYNKDNVLQILYFMDISLECPDFRMWEACRTMPLVSGFSRDLPFPPPFHSGSARYSTRFTAVGSQYFDVKNHPNLSTHSLEQQGITGSTLLRCGQAMSTTLSRADNPRTRSDTSLQSGRGHKLSDHRGDMAPSSRHRVKRTAEGRTVDLRRDVMKSSLRHLD
ncbi:hypothetical protein PR048_006296 [Dryococelus australis]|uniref:Uncharacterized protein n=1 Tax=Dryococelus australis TaxID=614101 RepID=A0ABQ9IAM5_9NEOP|nr:hypothetical protein PR048_006296 [Dryococelus australis]